MRNGSKIRSKSGTVLLIRKLPDRLLKNGHLLRCAANLIARRISTIRLARPFLRALYLTIFEQPDKPVKNKKPRAFRRGDAVFHPQPFP
jgi:hypothetical protein